MAHYELSLHDYWRLIKKRRWVIILTIISIIGSVMVFTNLQTPIYKAMATVKVEPSLVIPGVATDQSGWDLYTALNTEVKIIKSAIVAERTANKLNIINDSTPQTKRQQIISSIQGKINASRVGNTNLITIEATSSDPGETEQLANATAEVYIEKGIEDRNRRARELREFVEIQLQDAKTKLKNSEDTLKKYTEKSGAKGIGDYLVTRLLDIQSKKSDLLKKYTDQHPEVMRLNSQIRNIESQMRSLPAEELEYARLSREVKINEELYTLLAKRFKESQITEADRVQSAFIVTPATKPGVPIKPNKTLNLSVGVFLGIFMGLILALFIESLDTSIGTIEDVEKFTELPVLGIIPHLDPEKSNKPPMNATGKRDQRIQLLRSKLIVHHPSKSPFVESYHTLLTNLKFTSKQEKGKAEILSITSAGIGEGKTITASNFALVAAESGKKTLLIESDLRRPSLHWLFGMSKTPGLNECLTGVKKWQEVIRGTTDFIMGKMGIEKVLHYPGIENLSLITSGTSTPNPIDLFNSPVFSNMIKDAANHYDLIILDTPPALLFADPLLVANHCTGTLIVYQVGRMARRALKRTKDQLNTVKASVIGIILNNVKTMDMGSYYGYGYYYSYKYYNSETRDKPKKS